MIAVAPVFVERSIGRPVSNARICENLQMLWHRNRITIPSQIRHIQQYRRRTSGF